MLGENRENAGYAQATLGAVGFLVLLEAGFDETLKQRMRLVRLAA
jgi:hypothetical protein